MLGGHYTYAEVPLGYWVKDALSLARNHYDRLGHFAQGFVPAIRPARSAPPLRSSARALDVLPGDLRLPREQRVLRTPANGWTAFPPGKRPPPSWGPGRPLGHAVGHVQCAVGAVTAQLLLTRGSRVAGGPRVKSGPARLNCSGGLSGAARPAHRRAARLPGIGPKSAQRIAFHLLKGTREDAQRLAAAVGELLDGIRICARLQRGHGPRGLRDLRRRRRAPTASSAWSRSRTTCWRWSARATSGAATTSCTARSRRSRASGPTS